MAHLIFYLYSKKRTVWHIFELQKSEVLSLYLCFVSEFVHAIYFTFASYVHLHHVDRKIQSQLSCC